MRKNIRKKFNLPDFERRMMNLACGYLSIELNHYLTHDEDKQGDLTLPNGLELTKKDHKTMLRKQGLDDKLVFDIVDKMTCFSGVLNYQKTMETKAMSKDIDGKKNEDYRSEFQKMPKQQRWEESVSYVFRDKFWKATEGNISEILPRESKDKLMSPAPLSRKSKSRTGVQVIAKKAKVKDEKPTTQGGDFVIDTFGNRKLIVYGSRNVANGKAKNPSFTLNQRKARNDEVYVFDSDLHIAKGNADAGIKASGFKHEVNDKGIAGIPNKYLTVFDESSPPPKKKQRIRFSRDKDDDNDDDDDDDEDEEDQSDEGHDDDLRDEYPDDSQQLDID